MTRFTFKGDITWGSGAEARSFPIMMENQAGFDRYIGKMSEACQIAVAMLKDTIAYMGSATDDEDLQEYAAVFFRTRGEAGAEDFNIIKRGLVVTLNGLTGPSMAIKAGGSLPNPDASGWVSFRKREATQPYHNSIATSVVEASGDIRSGVFRASAVHIAQRGLRQHVMTVAGTVIHEASHKFLSTEDYAYFDGKTEKWNRKMTKSEALNNADSYAWFASTIYHVVHGAA